MRPLWNGLPAEYRSDVQSVVRTFGSAVDREMWDAAVGAVRDVQSVLKSQKEFVRNSELLGGAFVSGAGDLDPSVAYDQYVTLLDLLLASQLRDAESFAEFDADRFVDRTLTPLLKQVQVMASANRALGGDATAGAITTRVVKQTDEAAVVEIIPADEPSAIPEQETMRKVGSAWVPENLAESWPTRIADAKQTAATIDTARYKPLVMKAAAAFSASAKALREAETQAAFDAEAARLFAAVQAVLEELNSAPRPDS